MLTIGQMARCYGLTTKTLRHYDKIGLFRPAMTGSDNSYRYYRPEQMTLLGRIVWLRQLGMALETILALAEQGSLNSSAAMREKLQEHADQMAVDIAQQQQVFSQLTRYLAQTEWSLPAMQIPKRISFPAKRIIGMSWQQNDEGSISEMWQRFIPRENEIVRQLESTDSYGVCQPLDDGSWRYIAGLPAERHATIPTGMVALDIPAREYACVEHRGLASHLKETFTAAYSEWLPAAGMAVDEGIDFEHYDERFLGPMDENSVVEIYIPIKPL